MAEKTNLISVSFLQDYTLSVQVSIWLIGLIIVCSVAYIVWRYYAGGVNLREFEIDQAEMGVGGSKLRLRPNLTDRQVAYSIWVELSTRKIGLPIDLDHDVVDEIYDSWYDFFAVTRELLKSIPVNKVKSRSTQKIINLTINVLNDGLRPHLTTWQARFRRWYAAEVEKSSKEGVFDPQEIQKAFPRFGELKEDMMRVNGNLTRYRAHMKRLVLEEEVLKPDPLTGL